jgi:hypothetical protein
MSFTKRVARLGLLLTALTTVAAPSMAAVELIQLTPSNLTQYVSSQARQFVHEGDVVLRNGQIQVVILTSPTDSDATRAGRLIIVNGPESTTAIPVASLQIGPGSVWKQPEAGDNQTLGVVRFHREEGNWSSELTFRMHEDSGWVEIISKILNKNDSRVLEIPVVDTLTPLDGSEPSADANGGISMTSKAGISVSYLAVGGQAMAAEGRGGWNLGMISGDETPNMFRRASARVVSLGRSPQLLPLDASRDWNRQVRERANWYRIEPQKQRTIVRRLVVNPAEPQTVSAPKLAPAGAPTKPSTPALDLPVANPVSLPVKEAIVGHRRTMTPSAPQPTVEKPALPGLPHTQSFPKITGKLRSGDGGAPKEPKQTTEQAVDIEVPRPLPVATTPQPALPPKITPSTPIIAPAPAALPGKTVESKPAEDKPVESKAEDLTPTIEAIEDLPPPTE